MEQITQQERALNCMVDQIVDASLPQPQEESVEKLGRSRSGERTQAEVRVGPNTQDRAVHLTAETGHHIEEVIASCRPTGVAAQVTGNSSPSVPSDSFGRNTV